MVTASISTKHQRKVIGYKIFLKIQSKVGKKSQNTLCFWPHNTLPMRNKHRIHLRFMFSAHTRWLHCSLWNKQFGPIPQRNQGLRVQTPWKACKEVQHNEHERTSISLIHGANWSWDNRVLWEGLEARFTKVKLHRPMRWEARSTHI